MISDDRPKETRIPALVAAKNRGQSSEGRLSQISNDAQKGYATTLRSWREAPSEAAVGEEAVVADRVFKI